MKLNENGEYSQITVKIDDDVPDDNCEELLDNLKVSKDMGRLYCLLHYPFPLRKLTVKSPNHRKPYRAIAENQYCNC